MNVNKLAQRLVKRGMIDASTAASMTKFCKNLRFYDLLMGFGIAAVLVSLALILVANWARIPSGAKIGAHACLNGIVAFTLFMFSQKGKEKTFWFNPLIVLLAVLTLTFIVMSRQIFHAHQSIREMLTFWLLITAPFCLGLARSQHATRMRLLSFSTSAVDFIGKAVCALSEKFIAKHKYIEKYFGKKIPSFSLATAWPAEKIAKKLRPFILATFLVLPIISVLTQAAEEHAAMPVHAVVRLPIVSYDRESPMYGQYLRFRFKDSDAPDQKYHDYLISDDMEEIGTLVAHPNGHSVKMEVRLLGDQVMSLDMLYIDDLPWQDYIKNEKEQCRIKMGGDCL